MTGWSGIVDDVAGGAAQEEKKMQNLTDIELAEKVERYKAELADGMVWKRHERSARSVFGYQPPVNHRQYGRLIADLGSFAARGDQHASLVARMLARPISHVVTGPQLAAQVFANAAEVARFGYVDSIGNAGPEPERNGWEPRPYSPGVLLALHLVLLKHLGPLTGGSDTAGWLHTAAVNSIAR